DAPRIREWAGDFLGQLTGAACEFLGNCAHLGDSSKGGRHCSRRLLRVQRGLPPQPSANTICILSFLPRIHAFPGLSEMTEAARSLDFDRIREDMVERQIRTWEVFDQAVLDLMKVVPRENFVPDSMRALACADMNVPIGEGEVMLAPKVEGRMLQALAITRGDSILEVGTRSEERRVGKGGRSRWRAGCEE